MLDDGQRSALEELHTAFTQAARFQDPLGTVIRLGRSLELIITDLCIKAGVYHRSIAGYEHLVALDDEAMFPKWLIPHFDAVFLARIILTHAVCTKSLNVKEVAAQQRDALVIFRWYLGESLYGPRLPAGEVTGLLATVEQESLLKKVEPRRVFLSYAREDEKTVRALHAKFIERGHRPWMDKVDLLPGQDWKREIRHAIDNSDYFVACLSRFSVSKRGYVQQELKVALETLGLIPPGQIFLIPVRLEPCEIPAEFGALHWIDLGSEATFEALWTAVEGTTS